MSETNYFKDHSDEELANMALEHLKYVKAMKKNNTSFKLDRDNQFFQDLQAEIVQRFINEHYNMEVK